LASCFLDTTVLTDILLKGLQKPGVAAKAAVAQFDASQVPMYAIKEFKRGPLSYFKWMYDKFVTAPDFSAAMAALHSMSRSPRRYLTSTALEAVVVASGSITTQIASSFVDKYGPDAEVGKILLDEMRLALKRQIHSAWSRRHSVATETVYPLSCYEERGPYERRGLIELHPMKCEREPNCCLGPVLRARASALRSMKEAIDATGSERKEDRVRAKYLKEIHRKPKFLITDEVCRRLGDAIIVVLAPADATVLTTNAKDHRVLAGAIGKQVQTPAEVNGDANGP
jgi:hypothetical protein